MSPILKRDIGEHIRHARRLAAAVTGQETEDEHYKHDSYHHEEWLKHPDPNASGSSARHGIGVDEDEDESDRVKSGEWKRTEGVDWKGKRKAEMDGDESDEEVGEGVGMLASGPRVNKGRIKGMEYEEGEIFSHGSSSVKEKLVDLRHLLFEVRQARRPHIYLFLGSETFLLTIVSPHRLYYSVWSASSSPANYSNISLAGGYFDALTNSSSSSP